MERSGLTKNAVVKGLAELELFSWIVREKTTGRRNRYGLCYPSFKEDNTGTEVFSQVHPTEELAKPFCTEPKTEG